MTGSTGDVRPPLEVALDATPLLGTVTGVGRFTSAIITGLARRDDVAVTAYPLGLRNRGRLTESVPAGVTVRSLAVPGAAALRLWSRVSFPRLDRPLGRPHVVHGTNFVVPPARAARVVTVHDLTTHRFPELCHPATLAFPDLVRRAAGEGAWVHTVSHAVRSEVIDVLGLDPERVVAVPNGFDHVPGDPARGRGVAGHERYVLAVGTVEPRKDLPTLVRAADALARHHPDLVVVHAGGDGWGTDELDRAWGAMVAPHRFVRLGHVDAPTLADLYAGARVLAYPSIYEGFGLPVLEAMAAGVPVVTTDVPALREVAGDAAAIVPVRDTDALVDAVSRAWTDAAWRAAAIARGHQRAAAHAWSSTIDGLVALYRRAAGQGPSATQP